MYAIMRYDLRNVARPRDEEMCETMGRLDEIESNQADKWS